MDAIEEQPEQLVGWQVVEVGVRQAWPFLTLADPRSGSEVRLYVDGDVTFFPAATTLRQDSDAILTALQHLNCMTVTAVTHAQDLSIEFAGESLCVSSEPNELTSHSSWWIGHTH